MSYERVYFAQDEAATKPMRIIAEEGEQAAIDYLSDWHYPGEHMTEEKPSHGSGDKVFRSNGYILSYNPFGLYVGLEYETKDD